MCPYDNCLFYKRSGTRFIICAVYVDDSFTITNWPEESTAFKMNMTTLFGVKTFSPIEWFLGWHFQRDRTAGACTISQTQFTIDACKRFGLHDRYPKKQPCPTGHTFEELDQDQLLDADGQRQFMEKVGTLNYLATSSRSDIAWVTSKLGMYMQQGDKHAMLIADQVFLYLLGTADDGITIRRSAGLILTAFSDASFGDSGKTCNGRRRSQSGCSIKLGNITIVSYSRAQKNVTLSTFESEYVALSLAVQEVIWCRRLLASLGFAQNSPTVVYEDNEAAQLLASSNLQTRRSRFVDCRFHYTREMVAEGEIVVRRCPTAHMEADLFTKALSQEVLRQHWNTVRGETSLDTSALSLAAIINLTGME